MGSIVFKTAWSYIRRSPFQAMAAIFVLAITFFVATMLSILVYSSEKALTYYETRPQVIAFLKEDISVENIAVLQEKLGKDPRVENVRYVSKEDALNIYRDATADNPLLTELVSPSIFPASLEFLLTDLSHLENVVSDMENEEIVDEVGYTASLPGESPLSDVVGNLRRITQYIRIGGGGFVAVQLLSSFLVLIVIIMMRLSVRKREIDILDLIGATPGFIRNPIIIEAVVYSLVGVFLGWVAALLLVLYATPSIITYFGDVPVLPKDTLQLVYIFVIILAGEFLIGLFLAITGSTIAVSRARRKTKS